MFFFLVMVLSLLSVYGEEHMVGLCMNNFSVLGFIGFSFVLFRGG